MITKWSECGSAEIVPALIVFADGATVGLNPPYVKLLEPEPKNRPFIWMPKEVKTGFRATMCGEYGYTRFYTKQHVEILEASRKGYISQKYDLNIIPLHKNRSAPPPGGVFDSSYNVQ
jgi:hypothetical protein